MNFTIETLNDNGSGMKYSDKEEFMREISAMIDDCIANGGTFFDIQVDSDASCFCRADDASMQTGQKPYCQPAEGKPYIVSIGVDGRLDIQVEAASFEDAKEKAMDAFMDADITKMEIVSRWPVNAEAEDGTFCDYD